MSRFLKGDKVRIARKYLGRDVSGAECPNCIGTVIKADSCHLPNSVKFPSNDCSYWYADSTLKLVERPKADS